MTPALSPITLRAMRSTRLLISLAARRENVISRMRCGSAPLRIRLATRCASVFVLPEPAPAITSSGRVSLAVSPVPWEGAFRCCGLSDSSGSGDCMRLYINPVTANILVGTASWTDKTLIACGRFYPRGCGTAEQRLRYYAQQFPLVEVDSSYYAMPLPQTAQLWAERTPADFTFNVKAFRLFTGHQALATALDRDVQKALGPDLPRTLYYETLPAEIRDELWRRFRAALAPLQQAGKLGAVHFQFAPWLLRNRGSIAHVEHCVERMHG